jgi:hypothetical protein
MVSGLILRSLRIEVDVIGDEQIEQSVAIVIEAGAAGVPALETGATVGGQAALAATSMKVSSPWLRYSAQSRTDETTTGEHGWDKPG